MPEPMITRLRHGFCLQKEKYQKKKAYLSICRSIYYRYSIIYYKLYNTIIPMYIL